MMGDPAANIDTVAKVLEITATVGGLLATAVAFYVRSVNRALKDRFETQVNTLQVTAAGMAQNMSETADRVTDETKALRKQVEAVQHGLGAVNVTLGRLDEGLRRHEEHDREVHAAEGAERERDRREVMAAREKMQVLELKVGHGR
jgi:hypothetical protein